MKIRESLTKKFYNIGPRSTVLQIKNDIDEIAILILQYWNPEEIPLLALTTGPHRRKRKVEIYLLIFINY